MRSASPIISTVYGTTPVDGGSTSGALNSAARTAGGAYVDTSYADISSACDGALSIRFGFLVKNQASGTTLEMCRVGGRPDFT